MFIIRFNSLRKRSSFSQKFPAISDTEFLRSIQTVSLTLQRLKHVGFLYTFTSKYTRKHIRLMKFYKTFTTKNTSVSISDSIRLVSKPFIYSLFKLLYYLNFSYLLIYLLPNYEVDRNFQIVHYTYQYQNSLNHHLYSLLRKQNKYLFVF